MQRPNVVVIVLDDVGFAQLGCFGGLVDTPNIDALASHGLRFNGFHVTSICSSTRAAVLTGRNHHKVGMGFVSNFARQDPGYSGKIPRSAATVAKHLADDGYFTTAIGKWHLLPNDELTAAPPYDHWPTNLGFHHFYGFVGAQTSQWAPELFEDLHPAAPVAVDPANPVHLTDRLVDRAIARLTDLRNSSTTTPFFLYFAPGAVHSPHHVHRRWIDAQRGRYEDGWDAYRAQAYERQREIGVIPPDAQLSARPSWISDWAAMADVERRAAAALQEVFAGFLTHTDAAIGRLAGFLTETGELDNTLLLLMSDNGASAEGGPRGGVNEIGYMQGDEEDPDLPLSMIGELGGVRSNGHYPWGWAWAGNAPFRLWKRYSWLGGTRTPLVVHWPDGVAGPGEVKPGFCHAIDVFPTVLDVCGVSPTPSVDGVAQLPVQGRSLADVLGGTELDSRRTQYFEMAGSRAIFHNGWRAVTDHLAAPVGREAELVFGSRTFADDRWSLFAPGDFSEVDDLAASNPGKLSELVEVWQAEAESNDVLPLAHRSIMSSFDAVRVPAESRRREFRAGGSGIPLAAVPRLAGGGSITVTAFGGASDQGVLCASGDYANGFAMFVADSFLWAAASVAGAVGVTRVLLPGDGAKWFDSTLTVEPHSSETRVTIETTGVCSSTVIKSRLTSLWDNKRGPLYIGRDEGLPVGDGYSPPFPWTGRVDRVAVTSLLAEAPSEVLAAELEID